MTFLSIVAIGILVPLAFYYTLILALRLFAPNPAPPTPTSLRYISASHPTLPGLPLPNTRTPKAQLELSIVVPAYNESKRLRSGLSSALTFLERRRLRHVNDADVGDGGWKRGSYEVLIIDDGSEDETVELATKIAQEHAQVVGQVGQGEVRIVQMIKNRGKGGAVRHGLMHCRGSRILFADADGASQFSDVELLLAELDKIQSTGEGDNTLGLVVGSRAHLVSTPSVVSRSPLRNFLMRSFHFYLFVLGVRNVRDTQCGFKLMTRSTAKFVASSLHVEGWIFDVELILLASLTNPPTPISEVAVTWSEVSGSKLSVIRDSIVMAIELLVIRLCYGLGVWKIPNTLVK